MNLKYEHLATNRDCSMFSPDFNLLSGELREKIRGNRIVIVGAAGSIGSAVVKTLLRFEPDALCLIDISENNLVGLVRDLRATGGLELPEDFRAVPVGMGSVEFQRFFAEQPRYDYFFNLAALKHVRSEKDLYSLIRMLDTNVLFLYEFLKHVPYNFKKVFSVSSDKAANPANLMGASKMIMEQVLLHFSERQPFSTARFANVAFSDGSLPFGFLERIENRQPLAAPADIRRYFISHREAGELCVLSGIAGANRDVFFPKLNPGKDEKTFADIAAALLAEFGFEPECCESEEDAKRDFEQLTAIGKWPCVFSASDTDGEKTYEEFFTPEEQTDMELLPGIGIIKRESDCYDRDELKKFIRFLRKAKYDAGTTKEDYIRRIARVVPSLSHAVTGKSLDHKM